MKPKPWLICGLCLLGMLAGPIAGRAAAPPPAAAQAAPDDDDLYRSPQAYYVPEQEDVEELNQAVGSPSGGWGWLGRAFKGKPQPSADEWQEREPGEDQAP